MRSTRSSRWTRALRALLCSQRQPCLEHRQTRSSERATVTDLLPSSLSFPCSPPHHPFFSSSSSPQPPPRPSLSRTSVRRLGEPDTGS